MNVVCLFEQSGTFKRQLIAAGHTAIDIDIEDNFKETDYCCDLFSMLLYSPFTFKALVRHYDLAIAFFPCTWFSMNNDMILNGTAKQLKTFTAAEKQSYIDKRLQDRATAAAAITRMITLCKEAHTPLIIENPATPYIKTLLGQPAVRHYRNKYGDIYRKPTYWYTYGCTINEIKLQLIPTEQTEKIQYLKHDKLRKIKRSLMTAAYAANIINAIEVI